MKHIFHIKYLLFFFTFLMFFESCTHSKSSGDNTPKTTYSFVVKNADKEELGTLTDIAVGFSGNILPPKATVKTVLLSPSYLNLIIADKDISTWNYALTTHRYNRNKNIGSLDSIFPANFYENKENSDKSYFIIPSDTGKSPSYNLVLAGIFDDGIDPVSSVSCMPANSDTSIDAYDASLAMPGSLMLMQVKSGKFTNNFYDLQEASLADTGFKVTTQRTNNSIYTFTKYVKGQNYSNTTLKDCKALVEKFSAQGTIANKDDYKDMMKDTFKFPLTINKIDSNGKLIASLEIPINSVYNDANLGVDAVRYWLTEQSFGFPKGTLSDLRVDHLKP